MWSVPIYFFIFKKSVDKSKRWRIIDIDKTPRTSDTFSYYVAQWGIFVLVVIKLKDVKKPATYQEMIQTLRERNCIVNDEEQAMSILHQINYYRFTAYLLEFKSGDVYKAGTNFNSVYQIYLFDHEIRTVLYGLIEEIEIMLRTQLSYYHGHHYGALGYEYADNFDPKHDHLKFLKKIYSDISQNSNKLFVKHHVDEYGGKFPIWTVLELCSFGDLSKLYADFKISDRKFIAQNVFYTVEQNVVSWLVCLTELRNNCAHYERMYNIVFKNRPRTPKDSAYQLQKQLFDEIMVAKFIYPNKIKWNSFYFTAIKNAIDTYSPYINLSKIGFPDNWEDVLINK